MSGSERPHAPDTGTWLPRLLGRFHVTGVFWYKFHRFGVRIMPRRAYGFFILIFTSFFFVALRRIRGAIAANLAAVLGPAGWWETQRRLFRTMHNFAWCLTERYENLTHAGSFDVETENMQAWYQIAATGSGAILLTGHLGNWEIGSAMPSTEQGRDVHLVREEELDPRAQAFVSGLLRERMGQGYHTHFASTDPGLGLRLLDALRGGDVVALQGDRPRAGGKSLTVRLFGRPFDLPQGPAALARTAGVPLLPVVMLRKGRGRYWAGFGDPIYVARTARRNDDLHAAMQGFADFLERMIREDPFQWFCFKNLWGGATTGDASSPAARAENHPPVVGST